MRYRFITLAAVGLMASVGSLASILELDFVAPVASGEYSCEGGCPAVENELLSYRFPTQAFSVGAGDTVRARLSFQMGETFRLFFDPRSPAVGTQGFLIFDNPNQGSYQTSVGFTFAFLNAVGQNIASAFDAPNGNTSGDVGGNVTILQEEDWDVGGLFMEFSNFTDPIGTLPLTFSGVRFLITNGKFGEPFGTPPGELPEPASIVLVGSALLAFMLSSRRRNQKVSGRTAPVVPSMH